MKSNIYLDEAVLDDLAQDLDYLELPISKRAFRLLGWFVILSVLVVLGDVIYLNGFRGNFYSQKSLINASHVTMIGAERGIIMDRFGKPLSQNAPAFELSVKLADVMKDGDLRNKIAVSLEEALILPAGYIQDLFNSVNLEKQDSLIVARDLTVDQVLKIKNLNLTGVQIESDYKRQYPDGEIFSHILGYTGLVNKEDLAADSSLAINEIVGRTGLEAYYNKELEGVDGETLNYRNVKGEAMGQKLLKESSPGADIHTTIDADFQRYFYNRLKSGLALIGAKSGAGLAMNPETGEIISLISLPSYNNNKIESKYLIDSDKPLFNRAVSGQYSPGSVIKPLVAYAALKEGIISPDKKIYSPGYIELPNPYDPEHPSRFLDWRPQGWVDIYSALARSSDVYFYEVGGGFEDQKGLGINKLKDYWGRFGLDQPTGIDLPFENKGVLADPAAKEKGGRGIWRIGDTYNVSIGQGDLVVTPLEILNYISAIANGGKLMKPYVAEKIVTNDNQTIMEKNSVVLADYSGDSDIVRKVQKGMEDGVTKSYGTSYSLADLPFSVAAKTGTAQIQNNAKENAFFVGYAPASGGNPDVKPAIAILVLVENSREGSLNAVPIAKDILRWYYENRLK
ncbi:MAG: penicillin-binding transpeptidase domain-containing protein [Candidatus Wolfebacteria bacterium]|nr:penicillin-binding transpeptidase domain-containing protein [Candidatus Wolfebacteria bacterium]